MQYSINLDAKTDKKRQLYKIYEVSECSRCNKIYKKPIDWYQNYSWYVEFAVRHEEKKIS